MSGQGPRRSLCGTGADPSWSKTPMRSSYLGSWSAHGWVGPFDKGAPRRDPSLENYPHADDVRSGLHVRRWIVISQSFLGFSLDRVQESRVLHWSE